MEVLPAAVSQGGGIREIRLSSGFSGLFSVYFLDDDVTDECAFEILQDQGLTIKAGSTKEGAGTAFSPARPATVRQLQAQLAA
ncbi:MAG: hypothetical protein A2Z73_01455 [Deltaproteobacteria bacterium RBG_13_60_28]|nr:MAG: hypothetical protein A2Z73_01455 [Deltaproteobacteria bacterium RBG_13_60_28]